MVKIIIYIRDNELIIIYKKKTIIKDFKSIKKGYIIDKDLFINEFLNVLKKEKIKNKLFGDKIKIVKNIYFKEADLFFIEFIFNELGFLKITYIDIRKFLLDQTATYIEINKDYMVLYLKDGLYLNLSLFKDIPQIITYFKELIRKRIILFGSNKYIPQIKINNKDVYFIDTSKTFILDNLKKYDN